MARKLTFELSAASGSPRCWLRCSPDEPGEKAEILQGDLSDPRKMPPLVLALGAIVLMALLFDGGAQWEPSASAFAALAFGGMVR